MTFCYCGAAVLNSEIDGHINDHRDLPLRADLLAPVCDGQAIDVS